MGRLDEGHAQRIWRTESLIFTDEKVSLCGTFFCLFASEVVGDYAKIVLPHGNILLCLSILNDDGFLLK